MRIEKNKIRISHGKKLKKEKKKIYKGQLDKSKLYTKNSSVQPN